jgi:O-antigen/teichoic acid export membrane protein
MDTTAIVECAESSSSSDLRANSFSRDMGTLVLGSVLAAVFGAMLVFVVPRITGVEDFGYWRIFLLYGGYVGFFHLGFGEGALLCWAGKSLGLFREELQPSLKFLIALHLLLLVLGCLTAITLFPSRIRFVAIAVLVFAMLQNTSVLLQCALQAARQFRPVAVAAAAPSGLFLAFAALTLLRSRPDYRVLICCYLLAWLIVLGFLWTTVRPFGPVSNISAWTIGKRYITIGWPITLANTAIGLVQSSDRFVLSSAVSIYHFAQYSLAASTMMVPLAIISAAARVFFPHLAASDRGEHPEIYGQATRLIVVVWCVLLPYYFAVDVFVHRFLHAYVESLPVARTLLLGVLFIAAIQILQSSLFNLYGKQKHFLFYSIIAVGFSLVLAGTAVFFFGSLLLVAGMQVVSIGMFWLFNAWRLRSLTGESWRDFSLVVFNFAWSAISLWLAFSWTPNFVFRTLLYWLLAIGPLALTCGDEMRAIGRIVVGVNQIVSPSSLFAPDRGES